MSSLPRATRIEASGEWSATPVDTIVLVFDDRHRRRMAMSATRGLQFLLDLEQAIVLRSGDALVLDDGRLVEVVAAPEPLAEIRAADPAHMVRIAWHLGNRHLPVQIAGRYLRIRRDHVIEEMVRGLGARVISIEAPFDPEGGAYAGGHSGHHTHVHDNGHAHLHAHSDHEHHHGASHDAADHGHQHHGHSHAHHHRR